MKCITALTSLLIISMPFFAIPSLNAQTVAPSVIADGAYPDIVLDHQGNVHLVYARGTAVYYRKYTPGSGWSSEQNTTISSIITYQNNPDIVVDSNGNPHVVGGTSTAAQYAYKSGNSWVKIGANIQRGTEMAIDSDDNIYIIDRGGNNGGHMGCVKRNAGANSFTTLVDPDKASGLFSSSTTDHVYADLHIDANDNIHIVQRHATSSKDTGYSYSTNGGQSYSGSIVSPHEPEGPHVTTLPNGTVLVSISNYYGTNFSMNRRSGNAANFGWTKEENTSGSVILLTAQPRDEPEVTGGPDNYAYVSSHGGRYAVRNPSNQTWTTQKIVPFVSDGSKLGFMETAPYNGGAYAIWEEGGSQIHHENGGPGNSPASFDLVFATMNTAGEIGEPDDGEDPFCGDGIVNGDEECDDGNNNDWDGCQAECYMLFDMNGDGIITAVGDVEPFVDYVFFFEDNCPPPGCEARADGDGSGTVNVVGDLPVFADCLFSNIGCDGDPQ